MNNIRLDLHAALTAIPGLAYDPDMGGPAVYFQPPPTVMMYYPCIVYQLESIEPTHADNRPYVWFKQYQITVIDPDPDSEIPDAVQALSGCRFSRFYTTDNLNHYAFVLTYMNEPEEDTYG